MNRSVPLGRSPLRKTRMRRTGFGPKVRRDPARVEWSNQVRERDGFQCQRCPRSKASGFVMHAAHILGAGAFPSLKYIVANGITLCFLCHRDYDTHKGKDRNGDSDRWVRGKIGEPMYTHLLMSSKTFRKEPAEMALLRLRAHRKAMDGGSRGA